MNKEPFNSRRRFIRTGICGVAALHMGAVVLPVAASELPRLDEADPTAKALGYVHDASALGADIRVDATRVCSTCRFYPRAEQAWGTCALFPGKVVSAQGWCKAWVAGA